MTARPINNCSNNWLSVCIHNRLDPAFHANSFGKYGHSGKSSRAEPKRIFLTGGSFVVAESLLEGRPHLRKSSRLKSMNNDIQAVVSEQLASSSQHPLPHTSVKGRSHGVD